MGKVIKVPPNTLSFITRKNPTKDKDKDDAPHVQPYTGIHMFRPPKHITRRTPAVYKKVDIALRRLDNEFPKISKHPDAHVKNETSLLKTIKKQRLDKKRHNKDRRLIPGFKKIQEVGPSDKGSIRKKQLRKKQTKKKQLKKKQPKKKNPKTKKLPLSKKKRVKRN